MAVSRSLPWDREKSRNSSVTRVQTVCEPTSSGPVLQQPSRKKPVSGALLHSSSSPPSTFLAMAHLTTPLGPRPPPPWHRKLPIGNLRPHDDQERGHRGF